MSLDQLVETLRRRKVDVIAVTDHNEIEGALALRRLAPEGLRVIVAEEIKTSEGEIIGLFLDRLVPRGLSPEETVSLIKEQGGLVVIPHPFDRLRNSRLREGAISRIVGSIDAIEVHNARVHLSADWRRAFDFAREHRLAITAGSDSHVAGELGRTYVELAPFETGNAQSFLASLKEATLVGQAVSPFVHIFSTLNKLKRD